MDSLLALKDTPIPAMLVGGGLMFILVAILGRFFSFNVSSPRQAVAGAIGALLMIVGLAPYVSAPANTSVNTSVNAPLAQADSLVESSFIGAPMQMPSPNTFIVKSYVAWQTTNIEVEAGTQISIETLEGEWSPWGGPTVFTAVGDTSYICAEVNPGRPCNEPIGEAPIGMLIGRIGEQWFQVGMGAVITAETSGEVQLRINDADRGLFDNHGSVTVMVTVGGQ
jgi:hypothetical protein